MRIDLELTATGAVAAADARRARAARPARRSAASSCTASAAAASPAATSCARVPRGRYAFETVRLTIEDPFGLARASLEQGEPQALVVYPRLVALDRLFSEGGAHAQDGRRLLLRRPDRATSCTACASTPRASRCARCTGARRRGAAS